MSEILELKRQKAEAVRRSDYLLANELKIQIENLQVGSYAPPDEDPVPIAEPPIEIKTPAMIELDKRPIRPGRNGRYNFEDDVDEPEDTGVDNRRRMKGKPKRGRKVENLMEFQDNGPEEDTGDGLLEILEIRERQEADILINAIGEGPVRLFYSKTGANKVKGIKLLSDGIRSLKASQHPQHFAKFCHLLRLRLREELIGVFPAATSALMALSDNLRLAPEAVRTALEPHLTLIVGRLGHKREQIAEAAKTFVLWAADNDYLGIHLIGPMLIAPLKKPITWSNVQERLVVIQELLERFGTVDGAFEVQTIVGFVLVALDSKAAGVRAAACQVCKVLAGMGAAPQINRMLQASSLSTQTQNAVKTAISK
jgi:hypothetical protein